jgi:heme exporter protein C
MWYKIGSPKHFYPLAGKWVPWLSGITAVLLIAGLYLGLFVAPPDYQQGETVRIMFVHVPAAWMSLFIYMVMASAAASLLIWNAQISRATIIACAPLGASFTLLALVTGSIWGKPMWGTWWAWDARLTSELILFFLYLGIMALQASIDDPKRAARAASILILVGVVNIPVIHFSVEWWNTLHQPASVGRLGKPTIHVSILIPLLLMALAFTFYFFTLALMRMRAEVLEQEKDTNWVAETMGNEK